MYESNIYAAEKAVSIAPTPPVTMALRELAEAGQYLASVAEEALAARARLSEAQARYAKCADVVAKEREQAGV